MRTLSHRHRLLVDNAHDDSRIARAGGLGSSMCALCARKESRRLAAPAVDRSMARAQGRWAAQRLSEAPCALEIRPAALRLFASWLTQATNCP